MLKYPKIKLDFETRSKVNLKLSGAYVYSRDPSTQPTCLAFKEMGTNKSYFLRFESINRPWSEQPKALRKMWREWLAQGRLFSAHNAFFETCIYKNILVARYGWPDIPFHLMRCSAAKAAACALPRALGDAGAAMGLRIQKDKRGHAAMMATCKPTAKWNAWTKARAEIAAGKRVGPKKQKIAAEPEPPLFLEYAAAPETWEMLYKYCQIDVRAEEALDLALPDLSYDEQKLWFLNQKLNWRGLRVDIPTVKKIVGMLEADSKRKLKELDTLTMGLVTKPGARKSILEFLQLEDVILPDIKAKTVDDFLAEGNLSEDMRRLLEIRKELSKTSTKKYQAFLNRASADDRVRDIIMYHGGSTGRDAGTGIQPHNFPKGLLKVDKERPYAHVENIIECDEGLLQLLYGESLAVLFSAVLRNMIIPDDGYELFVADFSKIEVAVCWWLAGNEPGLEILRSGKDPYKYQAAANMRKAYEDIADDGDERQLGKAQVLGCQFGMGADRFQSSAWDMYRLKLTKAESKFAVDSYRKKNAAVPQMWKNVERAAISAIETPGKSFKVHRCKFFCKDNFLWIELPSGRRLAYRDPSIIWRQSEWGSQKTIQFWGVNPKTKKWTTEVTWGGKITENIVQAVARDLMMPAMARAEDHGYQALLSVHDEGICQKKKGTGSIVEFTGILCELPQWGTGLPLEAKGWRGPRYRK